MKKIIGLLLIAAMMLSLCGCMSILKIASQLGDRPEETTKANSVSQTGFATVQDCMEAALAVDHKFIVLPKEQHRKMYSEEHWEIMIQYAGLTNYDEFYSKYVENASSYAESFRDADISYQVFSELTLTAEEIMVKQGGTSPDEDDLELFEKATGTRNPEFLEVTYRFSASKPGGGDESFVEYGVFYFYERDNRWYVFKL